MLLCADSIINMIVAVYYDLSIHWLYLQIFGVVLSLIGAIGVFYIPETPEYLYSYFKFPECKFIMSWIAKENRKQLPPNYIFDHERERQEIRFSILTAGSNFKTSKKREKEIRQAETLQKSLRTTMREFLSDKIILQNLISNALLWFLAIMNY